MDRLLARWRWIAVVALRFMYGMRMAGPIVIGAGKMPAWEFMAANALGAILWSALIAVLGYVAGQAVVRMLGGVVGIEKALLALAIVAIIAAVVVRAVVRRRVQRTAD
jgi:membrane protein DedA with SNARE-associated domain